MTRLYAYDLRKTQNSDAQLGERTKGFGVNGNKDHILLKTEVAKVKSRVGIAWRIGREAELAKGIDLCARGRRGRDRSAVGDPKESVSERASSLTREERPAAEPRGREEQSEEQYTPE
jgi:hypothetical protein